MRTYELKCAVLRERAAFYARNGAVYERAKLFGAGDAEIARLLAAALYAVFLHAENSGKLGIRLIGRSRRDEVAQI